MISLHNKLGRSYAKRYVLICTDSFPAHSYNRKLHKFVHCTTDNCIFHNLWEAQDALECVHEITGFKHDMVRIYAI